MTGHDIRDDAREGFARVFDSPLAGLWSAPGRVNLIGEHTDYNDGFVLPFAIDRRTVVAVGGRQDRMLRVASAEQGELVEVDLTRLDPERMRGWAAYPLGVAWALQQAGADPATSIGVDVYIESTVPLGSGLSSSAAIENAVAVALNDLWMLGLDARALAKVGQRAENEAVGAPTGIMDQMSSLVGQSGQVVFLDCRTLETQLVPFDLDAEGLEVLVIDTGVKHAHADGGYRSRREACERGAAAMGVPALRDLDVDDLARARQLLDDETYRRVKHVVTEDARVLETVRVLRESGPRAIGELLDASHTSMRDDFEISVPELDLAVETAEANGALGARMTGGGFGGAAIALVPVEARSRVQGALDGAFAEQGFSVPETFVVRPSEGAGRA